MLASFEYVPRYSTGIAIRSKVGEGPKACSRFGGQTHFGVITKLLVIAVLIKQ